MLPALAVLALLSQTAPAVERDIPYAPGAITSSSSISISPRARISQR